MADEANVSAAPVKPEEIASMENVDPALRPLIDAGLFFGRTRSKTHPRMRPYIVGTRNEFEIIDVAKTQEFMDRAAAYLTDIAGRGAPILFVATEPVAQALVALAKELGYPFVGTRWLGGTLTNFKVISGRIEYLKKLEADAASGAIEKYTKKERLMIDREMKRLEESLGGLRDLGSLPEAIVMVDANVHMTAVREARRLRIPVVALVNTDTDPDLVAHPVPGNNKSRASIAWFTENVRAAVEGGRRAAASAASVAAGEQGSAKDSSAA